jgi:zinc-ribbon domain
MALIPCPDCGKKISDKAPSCPSCGYAEQAQTIEQTAKTWKAVQALGVLMIAAGIPIGAIYSYWGWPTAIAGVNIWLFGRICAWWENG